MDLESINRQLAERNNASIHRLYDRLKQIAREERSLLALRMLEHAAECDICGDWRVPDCDAMRAMQAAYGEDDEDEA
jgi:hypothetical protein